LAAAARIILEDVPTDDFLDARSAASNASESIATPPRRVDLQVGVEAGVI
jgi:hypothetical protein